MNAKTALEINDIYNYKFIKNMSIDNSGEKIAYVLTTYHDNEKKDKDEEEFFKEERTNIWIYNTKTQMNRQYTFGKINFSPSWSPDGKTLAFISKRNDGEPQIYLLSPDGGEAQQLTNQKLGVTSVPIWSPNGKTIVYSASKMNKKPNTKKPYKFTREMYRLDALGNVDHFRQDIFTINIETKEIKQLTDDEKNHTNPSWSPDGSSLLWLTNFLSDSVDAFFPILSIYKNNVIEEHLKNWGYCTLAEWITNEDVVIQGFDKEKTYGSKYDIFKYNTSNKQLEIRSESCKLGIGGGIEAFMPGGEGRLNKLLVCNNKVYTNVQDKGKIIIQSFSLNDEEEIQEVIGGDRTNFIQKIANGRIFFGSSNLNNPFDIYSAKLDGSQEERHTSVNEEFLQTKTLPEVKHIEITSIDGIKTDGWLMIPSGLSAPYPTLLKIHGGPHAGYGHTYLWDAHLLCNAGYAVYMINHRGSTGYGDEFATAINGDWGNLDYQDLMYGIDKGIELGLIDGERLGCFGISGGGNLSCWIVGQTDRFKAAAPENPVTNWLSFYGVSDIGRWFSVKELGGLPHEIPETYVKCSPITYAHKCKTPTLLIQHDNDLRCPVEQTEQFYAVLRDNNCVVEMLRMPGTPHGGSIIGPLEIRHARNEALLEWFKKYV